MGSFFDTIGPFLPGPLEIIGFYGKIFLPILVLFFIARMIFPGRAPIGFRRDLIDGAIRTIHITPHIPGVDSTVRYMSVATIEATTPNGVVKYKDIPASPGALPSAVRRQIFKRPLSQRSHRIDVGDTLKAREIRRQIQSGGYDFTLPQPVRVKLVPPKKEGKRLWYRVVN
ncbi:hypothetical protein QP172_03180 [Corynebacterium coyleae]|uniref:hypothetical protein n=1 Tax=Corynebacterium coyleae TaxID=53374 RepID=UPI00254E5E21|nr:hypothetical protein [Corynebacterium coyleae]MDK6492736.1 hypothetical protein [Corynebacterium coyleae]